MKKIGRNDSAYKKKAPMPTELYAEEEVDAVENYIEANFGTYGHVFHEVVSPDIHLDICIVEPTEERSYYMLVTLGMGAHRMNVPAELADRKLERAELAIALPRDWNIHENAEEHYWPIRLLKTLARLPIEDNTWLGWGHTIDGRSPYAKNTALSAALIVSGQVKKGGSNVCVLPDGDEVNFYQIIPLYKDELKYKLEHDADALLDRFAERHVRFVIDPQRRSALAPEDFTDLVMDNAQWHLDTLREKKLPVDELTAYNHLAIYLRWCIKHELMADWFVRQYAATIAQRWDAWKRNSAERKEKEDERPNDVALAIMQYLNCGRADCTLTYFPPMADDDPIMAAYSYAVRRSVHDGYVPVLIVPSDTLWEILTMNAEAEKGVFEDYDFDADAVVQYREKMLAQSIGNGKAILTERLPMRFGERREEAPDDEDAEEFRETDHFISYWDYETQKTQPMILAKIPVKNPWEVFAYLPFGGWNDCPDTTALMAVSKYWHEQHGAVPAVLTYDTLEYSVPAPIAEESARELAAEQYAFCADIVEQGAPSMTVGKLAADLKRSNIWYFWWD
ncbi:MAG: suppressor of fused domain protein [Selenomonas artemidis]